MSEEAIQISGIAIRLEPAKMESVKQGLQAIEQLEIHAEDPAGKLVITLEGRNAKGMTETIAEIEAIDGVAVVSPVYIHDETTL
jgi:nitrate reductase NapD